MASPWALVRGQLGKCHPRLLGLSETTPVWGTPRLGGDDSTCRTCVCRFRAQRPAPGSQPPAAAGAGRGRAHCNRHVSRRYENLEPSAPCVHLRGGRHQKGTASVATDSRRSFGSPATVTLGARVTSWKHPALQGTKPRAPQPGRGVLEGAPAGGVRGPQAGAGGQVMASSGEGQDGDGRAGMGSGAEGPALAVGELGSGPGEGQSGLCWGRGPASWRPGVTRPRGRPPPPPPRQKESVCIRLGFPPPPRKKHGKRVGGLLQARFQCQRLAGRVLCAQPRVDSEPPTPPRVWGVSPRASRRSLWAPAGLGGSRWGQAKPGPHAGSRRCSQHREGSPDTHPGASALAVEGFLRLARVPSAHAPVARHVLLCAPDAGEASSICGAGNPLL